MASSDEELKRISTPAAVMTAVDSVVGSGAGGLPAVTRNMAGLTSAGFSAGSAYIAVNL